MMDTRDAEPLEENSARLVRAAMEPGARPASGLRRDMLRRLLRERARLAPVAFPDSVVVLLGALWLTVAGVLAWLLGSSVAPLAARPALLLAAVGLGLNLALVPVAGIVVVLGRKRG